MKYAKEVIELMEPYPGRDWKMAELVNYVAGGRITHVRERNAARQAVLRVIDSLSASGQVIKRPSRTGVRNVVCYRWKP